MCARPDPARTLFRTSHFFQYLATQFLVSIVVICNMLFSVASIAQEVDQADSLPTEIIVTGKQPGPPLWRVRHGDNTLYIFAWLSPIPKDIYWESTRVEQVIAEAQEYITMPDVDVSVSPLVMFNPINLFRGMSLGKKVMRNEDDASLEEVLPADLYRRFSALKTQYFPNNTKIENFRPLVASGQMVSAIQKEAGLVPAGDVGKRIQRLVKRNKNITVTEIEYKMRLEGGFKVIANRVEELMDSIPRDLELSCFERQLNRMEEDLDEMQYRASTWAQGYIEEFKFIPLTGDDDDDCTNMLMVSSEQDTMTEIWAQVSAMWLDAAESALIKNKTSFAVLDFSQLLLDDGLLAQLAARGYQVIEP